MNEPQLKLPSHWKKVLFSFLFILFVSFSLCIYLYSAGNLGHTWEMNSLAHQGRMLWSKHNCTACHQVYGLGGYLGPDLTHFMSLPEKGKNYASAILQEGMGIMPAFHMNAQEIAAIVEYLQFTDSSGIFPGDGSPKTSMNLQAQERNNEND